MPDFRQLFETASDACLVLSPAPPFTVVAVADAYLHATATSRDRLVGRAIFDVFPGSPAPGGADLRKTLRESIDTAIATGRPHEISPHGDNAPRSAAPGGPDHRPWRIRHIPILNADGAVTAIVHRLDPAAPGRAPQARDTPPPSPENFPDHLEGALEPLLATEARYRLVVDSLQDYAIFMLDDQGTVTHWNAGAERLLGYTEAEALGQNARIFFTPEDQARGEPEREMETAKATGSANDDRWHLRKDGTRFFVTGLMSALHDARGRRMGLAKIMRDITDRQAAAAERERLLENERTARAEAERTSRLKDDFLATLSHELRTPLNAILGWTQVLKEGDLDAASIAEGLEIIDRNTHVQAQLIEDLLDMSRIAAGKVELNLQPLDLTTVIGAAVDSVRTAAAARRIQINTTLAHGDAALLGDRVRFQQVVWNLLSNAIKFTPAGGTIEITTERSGPGVLLRIRDNGAGIAPDFLPHIFERFRQADASTTRRHGGLGLGLSIVRQLVELHGGEVHAESPGLGAGTTFVVSLPVADNAASGAPAPRKLAPPRATGPIDLRGVKVLVVEDEPDSAHLVKRVLENHRAEVRAAASMHEALDTFASFQPHVLLSDIGMPHHDGYEFIRRVRTLPGGADVPAAALTALARREDVARALAAGFRTHLAKPVEPASLVALVARLAGRPVA